MLKISLDEAYVFDILSIYQVKINLAETEEKRIASYKAYANLIQELQEQLPIVKLGEILCSEEYNLLYAANDATFNLVEMARSSEKGLAKEVDDSNVHRYNAKIALQKRFFDSELSEIKTQI